MFGYVIRHYTKVNLLSHLKNLLKQYDKVSVRQVDNLACCLNFIYSGRYICITDSIMDDFNGDSKLDFVNLTNFKDENKLYFTNQDHTLAY